jgi:hypothetical protein
VAKRTPKKSGTVHVSALAEVMRRDHIAQVTLDATTGNITGMVLAPTAYLLDEKRRQERVAAERAKAKGKDGLPVEPDNPLREQLAKSKQQIMVDGVPVDDDDEDMYAHTGGVADPFTANEDQH